MKTTFRLVLCGMAAFALSGCHFFQSNNNFRSSAASRIDSNVRIEMGREALQEGAIAAAIHHFELAILDPDRGADAYNGLGVAYARLGREDLAARYFNTALRLRPSEPRFARNLARLDDSELGQSRRALARKKTESAALVAQLEREAKSRGYLPEPKLQLDRRGAITLDNRRTTITRLSDREIVIGRPVRASHAEHETAIRAAYSDTTQSGDELQQKPKISIRVETPTGRNKSGQVLTNPASSTSAADEANSAEVKANYPIRVSLNDRISEIVERPYPIRVSLKR